MKMNLYVFSQTPFLADLKPSGKFVMEDVQNIGGTPGLIKFLIDNGMFDGDQMTVTGKTHNENLAEMNHPGLTPGQEIIRPLSDPIKPTGHLQIMYGNLCPGGGVAKITGKEGETFTGTARVSDNEQLMLRGRERQPRILHRTHHTRSPGWRPDCSCEKWRPNPH